MTTEHFLVPEISCQHCVNAITKEVRALPGVANVVVNLNTKDVQVDHDAQVSTGEVIKAINEAGYDEVSVLS